MFQDVQLHGSRRLVSAATSSSPSIRPRYFEILEQPCQESTVEQPAESSARSTVAQPAETFASIEALNRRLKTQSDASSGADFQRLRAAVALLTKQPQPRRDDIRSLCSSWKVLQTDKKEHRPLTTLIAELQQAVVAEGNKLCSSSINS